MKIIRWLLSHIILILLVVTVIYGYMFWGNLLGDNTPAGKAIAYLSEEFEEVAEFVDAVKAKQSNAAQEQSTAVVEEAKPEIKATTPNSAQTLAVVTKDEEVQVDTIKESDIEQRPVSISYSHNNMRVIQSSDGEMKTTRVEVLLEETVTEEKVAAEQSQQRIDASSSKVSAKKAPATPEAFVSVEVEEQLDNLDEQGKVIDALKNETLRESWIVARKSFYQRNYTLSEQSYLKVIESSDNNYDAYGELGNVYFNQGKNQQAASAYYEAAAILVKRGQISRARSLIGLLQHLDESKASELKKLLASFASKEIS